MNLSSLNSTDPLTRAALGLLDIHASTMLLTICFVEQIYREVKVMAIGGGSEEIMRDLAVRQMGL